MSVKRYTCAVRNGPNGIYAEMAVRDNGAFVLTEDHEALAAENDKLRFALAIRCRHGKKLTQTCKSCADATEDGCERILYLDPDGVHLKSVELLCSSSPAPDYDPTPWCSGCGAMRKADCKCGELASND